MTPLPSSRLPMAAVRVAIAVSTVRATPMEPGRFRADITGRFATTGAGTAALRASGAAPGAIAVTTAACPAAAGNSRLGLEVGFEDAVVQLAAAQAIILTKLDHPGSPGRRRAKSPIQAINPLALMIENEDTLEGALGRHSALSPRVVVTRGRPVFFHADAMFEHSRTTSALAAFPTRTS